MTVPVARSLLLAALAALSAGALAASAAQAPGLPRSCPPASVLRTVLGLKVAHVTSYAGPISSTTLAGMGPAPDSAHYKKTAQTERTCTYSGSPTGPITISFIAPMTADAFSRSRTSLRKTGVAVASVGGIGDTAWAVRAGGLLFVLKGSVDIVISAPRMSVAHLKALAGELV
jgi:hypothetical protein